MDNYSVVWLPLGWVVTPLYHEPVVLLKLLSVHYISVAFFSGSSWFLGVVNCFHFVGTAPKLTPVVYRIHLVMLSLIFVSAWAVSWLLCTACLRGTLWG